METQYNVLIDVVGTLLVGAIFVAERRQKHRGDTMYNTQLFRLMHCCMLVLLTDIPGLLLDGCVFPGARALLWVVDSAYWLLQILYCWLWLLFADYWVNGSLVRLRRYRLLYAAPMALEVLLILTNPLTGWVFTINADNVYIRGDGYLLNMALYFLYIAAALGVSIAGCLRTADPERRRKKFSLALYMFLPVCGFALDIFVYGISWVWPMAAVSLLMAYLNVQQQVMAEKQLAAAQLQTELTEGRVAIMLSQIQPHFLYNALNTVDALCDVDTKKAQTAVRSFARYLRGNLDALSRKTPVPFREELFHLRQYLTLENFRFDNIEVVYDLETEDFMLPPLSLQPIVENAVKHGILQRRSGGVITISTRTETDCVRIIVADNGVGFDVTREPEDGRSHIGISNVRGRLESMCGGTLTVESTPNVGTTVTFIIPRGGASTCEPSR